MQDQEQHQTLGARLGLGGALLPPGPLELSMSPNGIGTLGEALAKAQGSMKPAKRDAENPFFKSKYAGLSSVWDSIRQPLSSNGLSVSQLVGSRDGLIVVTTMLIHASGEWLRTVLEMRPEKPTPQGMGSCLSYARRYALSGITGVSTGEEDDANLATKHPVSQKLPPKRKPAEDLDKGFKEAMAKDDDIEIRRLKILDRLIHKDGLFPKDVKGARAWVQGVTGGADIQKLNPAQCVEVEDAARKKRLDQDRSPGQEG